MDTFTLNKLEFDRVRHIVSRYCRSDLGEALAGRIGPSKNPETVVRWLDETTQMVSAMAKEGPPPFAGVKDITEPMARAAPGGAFTGEDFAIIAAALEGAGAIRRWALRLDDSNAFIRKMGEELPDFAREVDAVRQVVDPRGDVLETASETLARVRRNIAGTRQRIHEVIYGYLRRPEVSRLLQNPTVALHEDRFVLPVKVEHRHGLAGVVHRASNTGATVFVEPTESVEMNNALVELMDEERREVARLLNELAIVVARRKPEILAALKTLSQIDLVSAKAQYAQEFECVAPQVTERGGLQLHQVRHPLLVEQAYQQETRGTPPEQRHPVVPIDVRLGMDFDLLIVTGSNTGGKTVALKTVGLAVIMAQSGMHIPAQRGSTLPVFRDVLLDVGDEQSLQQSLSTFGAHVRRINHILRRADRYSLVLLDELGSGTDPDEGAAIGQAVMDELRRLSCLAMITTHLGALKAYAINHDRVDNASVEFDTRTLRPTYHLRVGEPGESHAITVAAAMGLPRSVISAARAHLDSKTAALHQAIRSTTAVRRGAEAARSQAHTAKIAAQTVQEQYEAKLADLQRLQQNFEAWLASLPDLKAGDTVQVPHLDKPGKLVRVQFNKQIAVVDVDNLQIEVPLAELMPDLGQGGLRKEIETLREQVMLQGRQSEALRKEAHRLHEENRKTHRLQVLRQQQFDRWLSAVGSLKVGQEVPIARLPGSGKLVEMDLANLRAKVQTDGGVIELTLQELFPQAGPFAPRHRTGTGAPADARTHHPPGKPKPPDPNRPMYRRDPASSAARASKEAVTSLSPGQQVYVVPFHKRAILIRFNEDKTIATVQAGAFEMQMPVADLDLPREKDKEKEKPATGGPIKS